MEKSAVEFIERQLIQIGLDIDKNKLKFIRKSIDQAKEMEKQQIINAYKDSTSQFSVDARIDYPKSAEQYYNEQFKNK